MKALLLTAARALTITDIPMPIPAARELLVRIKSCGICGSDVHGYDLSTGRRIPPIVMGHEAAGIIESIGSSVTTFRPGDRITFDSTIYCNNCAFCRNGDINLCDHRRVLGVSCPDYRQHGCFAEYVAIPQHIAYKLPDSLSFDHAAMIEAVSIAVHAVGRVPSIREKTIVVIGAGMIGQLILQVARAGGCGKLIALDIDESRLVSARRAGADHTLLATASDLIPMIMNLTENRGADIAFEAVGSEAPFKTAVASVRKGGSIVLVGNTSASVQFPLQTAVTRQLSLLGTCASAGEYPACLDLLATKKVNVAPLLSAAAPLEEGPAWFERLYNKESGLMKVILRP